MKIKISYFILHTSHFIQEQRQRDRVHTSNFTLYTLHFILPSPLPPVFSPLVYAVRLAAKIEAILYLKGQPLSIAQIAQLALCDRATVEEGLIELIDDYAHRESALEVVETPTGYSLQLRASFQDLVQTLIPVELGVGALRTLAAIALHNPITQTELVNLRGSGAYQHVQELVELGFVRKRRVECRSSQLYITDKFHQYFQLDQLPPLMHYKGVRGEG